MSVEHSGWLKKLGGGLVSRNQDRFFVLRGRELLYYKQEPKGEVSPKGRSSAGAVDLLLVDAITADPSKPVLILEGVRLSHAYTLTAASQSERDVWVEKLRSARKQAGSPRAGAASVLKIDGSSLLVRVCTWNVAELLPSEFPGPMLTEWVMGQSPSGGGDWVGRDITKPDIVAVGLEEVDMSAAGIAADALSGAKDHNQKADAWRGALGACVGSEYELIGYGHEASVMLLVWVHKSVQQDPDSTASPVAFWRGKVHGVQLGNKGTVAVRVKIGGRSLCFAASHLAPHPEGNAKRNEQYHSVLSELEFERPPRKLLEHDHVFWTGDLNYRLTPTDFQPGKGTSLILDGVEEDVRKVLTSYDQLSASRRATGADGAFQDFHEAEIMFHPTYKLKSGMDPGRAVADQFLVKTEAHHLPAYCDRVLYYSRAVDLSDQARAVLRLWRPPPLIRRPAPRCPDAPMAKQPLPSRPPQFPAEMAAIGVIPIDYSVCPLHTDHRAVYGLFTLPDARKQA
eukprot:TRINITY_DN32215_c0_g1_i1.p1 TRINITY_DN32215_c0_g1~~TRINITY_DN32215_c0_g1_i1.p1  ORF type:complete len:527 (+),score=68.06 TRINITY_DN32215_c0_g1_i1:51-1583(+)